MANEKLVTRETAKKVVEGYTQELEQSKITVGISKNIAPISEESGTIQETPFILQGTGTANNTDSVDTSPVGKQLEKQGNTVCVNQLAKLGTTTSTTTDYGIAYTRNQDTGVATFSGTSTSVSNNNISLIFSNTASTIYSGHKYLVKWNLKGTKPTDSNARNNLFGSNFGWDDKIVNGSNTTTYCQVTIIAGGTVDFSIQPQVIDLTQWFNGDIPQDLLDHPEHWSWYQNYGNYIAYNTGTLVNCSGRYLVNTYRNQWDEEWELGQVDTSTGALVTSTSWGRTKNYINVIPNAQYYLKSPINLYMIYYDKNKNYISSYYRSAGGTFTIPSNCVYMKMTNYGWKPYNHDITISLYYATGDGYTDYYPYQEPSVYDTGNEVLLAFDTKLPSGLIHGNTATQDLSQLSWTYDNNYYSSQNKHRWYANVSSTMKLPASNDDVAQIKCNTYVPRSITDMHTSTNTGIAIATNGNMYVYNNSGTNSPTGNIEYFKSTPTTEQGTPFTENINIDDYGTMAWLDTNNDYVDLPQGTKLFYPAWYVGFIDSLGQRSDIDWDAGNVVSQTQLGVVDTKHDNLYAIMQENVGGALRHQLADSDNDLSFDNTAWVDMGTLNWIKGDAGFYAAFVSTCSAKQPSGNEKPNLLSPLYMVVKAQNNVGGSTGTYETYITSAGNLYYKVPLSDYADGTAFKNAMKGILLAYEKAS